MKEKAQTLTAVFMLYGPFFWCYFRKEPWEAYGLVLRWTRPMMRRVFLYSAATLLPLTVVALLWPWGEPLPRSVPWKTFFLYTSAGLTAAVVEEVFFRGFLQTIMASRISRRYRILLSAAVFAASHMIFRTSPLFLATFFPGILMASLKEEFQNITPSIAYHFIGNLWAIWFFPGI